MNDLTTVAGGVSILDEAERGLDAKARRIRDAYADLGEALESGNAAKGARALDRAEGAGVLAQAEQWPGLESRPAGFAEIKYRVGALVLVMKNLEKVDPQLFVRQLCEDIAAELPTRLGLSTAMRKIRTSEEFLPSIATVIRTIREVESDYRSTKTRAGWLPGKMAEARAFLENNA
jgi:hypothetical protein